MKAMIATNTPVVRYAENPAVSTRAIAPIPVRAIPAMISSVRIFSVSRRSPYATMNGHPKTLIIDIITGSGEVRVESLAMMSFSVVGGDTIKNLAFSTYSVKFSYLRILAENFFENAKKVIVCVTKIDYYDYYDLFPYTRMYVCMGVP